MKEIKRPEWTPDNPGAGFTTNVMDGIEASHDGMTHTSLKQHAATSVKRAKLTTEEHVAGVLAKDLNIISRTITLVESNSKTYIEAAQQVLKKLLPYTGKAVRIGITGLPGAGKSTFIEAFGSYLCNLGLKVAVLAIDPSSQLTKGSILGDKTRMEMLSRNKNAFIRPSPSGGTLGGVARKTRETMLVCEAAGYDVVLVETVGIGQSETTVREMVDFFLLVLLPGAGDELQGIKKGSVEIADALIVNKADGDNVQKAELTASQYRMAVHYIQPSTEGWETKVGTVSAIKGNGIPETWQMINDYMNFIKSNGFYKQRRDRQTLNWVYSMVEEQLLLHFYEDPAIKEMITKLEPELIKGEVTPTSAVTTLLDNYFEE
ncbi:MAG: methylmalonyl Co-A mutase-associated GTPase MeaB [Candidatus Kapabacteria bacterium]|nr:methylmalonyl Co-A mutase-associated GTPase MeaB [Candidatus Kapabacteria bacterium]